MRRRLSSNKQVAAYTATQHDFVANNCFARTIVTPAEEKIYTVYSWGDHWPLYVYVFGVGRWFENSENFKHTVSTRQHARVCCPALPAAQTTVYQISLHEIRVLARGGLTGLTEARRAHIAAWLLG